MYNFEINAYFLNCSTIIDKGEINIRNKNKN